MNLYFYIRTWLRVSCGYKKKNTWQRVRAVRQVQSFHSKHICVCWASVALGRQARRAATTRLQSLGLPSAERAGSPSDSCRSQLDHRGGVFERRDTQASFPASLHADRVRVKSKCASSLELGFREQPGDSATAKLSLGVFWVFELCCSSWFCVLFFFFVCCLLGFTSWSLSARSNPHPCRNTSADLQSGPFTASV